MLDDNMKAIFTLIYSVKKHYNRRWKKRCEVHPGNSKWDSSHDGEHNITKEMSVGDLNATLDILDMIVNITGPAIENTVTQL